MATRWTRRRISPLYIIAPLLLGVAVALGSYSFRYAARLAQTSEQSILDSNKLLGDQVIARIENMIIDADRTLFDLVDMEHLSTFQDRWSYIVRVSPVVEAAVLLDEHQQVLQSVSKRKGAEAEAFRHLFEQKILPDLQHGGGGPGAVPLERLELDLHKHFHKVYDGRDYLISYMKRNSRDRIYYIVLKVSIEYVQKILLPNYLGPSLGKMLFCVRDGLGRIVYGEPVGNPGRFLYKNSPPTTLYLWTLEMAPRDAASLIGEEYARRRTEFLLITVMMGTIVAGIGFLFYATWKESRANALKSEFISNVSHELKTPLSLIRMFGELLALGKLRSPEKGKEYAEIITREADRLTRLIDNVLDFARMERGRAAYEFSRGRLDEVVERSLDVYRHRVEREGLRLSTKIDVGLPETLLDENAMTLLLLNLLENAVKYGKGEIAVYLTRVGNQLRLVVGDQGPGIPRDEQRRIFDRFYRTREARGTNVRGSGIGLSLVKHIAEAHGGSVSVDSEPGRGAAFIVDIPLNERAQAA